MGTTSRIYGQNLTGTNGADLYTGPFGWTRVTHLGGDDTARVSFSDDRTTSFLYHGGEGTDLFQFSVNYEAPSKTVVIDLNKGTFTLPVGSATMHSNVKAVENVTYDTDRYAGSITTQMSVKILGSKVNNVLIGGDAGAVLKGRGGHDELIGGTGDDVIRGGGGSDDIKGGGGNDRLYGDGGYDVFTIEEASATQIFGGSGGNVLVMDMAFSPGDRLLMDYDAGTASLEAGGIATMVLQSIKKVDALNVLGDVDTEFTGTARDNYVQTRGGDDDLRGKKGDDDLIAGEGRDYLDGGQGDDFLSGEAGEDLFIGGKGQDTMLAGFEDGDIDEFRFASDAELHKKVSKTDEIREFEAGIDKINLSFMDADVTTPGEGSAYVYATQATAHSVWFEEKDNGNTILWGDNDGDAQADWALLLRDTLGLGESDLILTSGLS